MMWGVGDVDVGANVVMGKDLMSQQRTQYLVVSSAKTPMPKMTSFTVMSPSSLANDFYVRHGILQKAAELTHIIQSRFSPPHRSLCILLAPVTKRIFLFVINLCQYCFVISCKHPQNLASIMHSIRICYVAAVFLGSVLLGSLVVSAVPVPKVEPHHVGPGSVFTAKPAHFRPEMVCTSQCISLVCSLTISCLLAWEFRPWWIYTPPSSRSWSSGP